MNDSPFVPADTLNTGGSFRRFWLSRVLGQTAQSALLYGLLIVIVDRTSSGIWPSLFVIASIVPSLLFGLPGGVVADWLPQRGLMLILNGVRAAAIGLVVRGDVGLLDVFIITVAIWIVHQFYAPAESALLPKLVSLQELPNATSRYNLALSIAQLLGMVILAPIVLKFGSVDVLLGICAALYLLAALLLARVQVPPQSISLSQAHLVEETSGSLTTGWRMMVQSQRAFGALVDSVMVGIGLSALVVIVPQFLESVLETGADNTVFVFAPAALGVVVGLQLAPLLGRIVGFSRLAAGGLVLFAGAILAISSITQIADFLVSTGVLVGWLDQHLGLRPVIAATMMLSVPAGLAVGLVNVAIRTELVLQTPPESHARVFATQMTIANLGALLPTLAAGLLIDIVGVRPVAFIIAVSLLAGGVLGRRIGGSSRIHVSEVR